MRHLDENKNINLLNFFRPIVTPETTSADRYELYQIIQNHKLAQRLTNLHLLASMNATGAIQKKEKTIHEDTDCSDQGRHIITSYKRIGYYFEM